MTSTPVVPNVCHDNIVRRLRDAGRVTPKHEAHLPPVAASPPTDPLPEPWNSLHQKRQVALHILKHSLSVSSRSLIPLVPPSVSWDSIWPSQTHICVTYMFN
jgi:hypothetical protein